MADLPTSRAAPPRLPRLQRPRSRAWGRGHGQDRRHHAQGPSTSQIAADPARGDERVLFTTFTVNLARDIEANLKTLCPEHLVGANPRIEVKNLDGWVGEFLRRRNFDRRIVYYVRDGEVDRIWQEVLESAEIPEGLTPEFTRNEWAQVVQAKGVETKGEYFKVSRAGRGTPLDRKKRAKLWPIFEAFRARMRDEGLAEPDDAYRKAIATLEHGGNTLPYSAVVLDESQDMGEQAFRLVAAIASGASDPRNSLFMVGDAHQRIYDRKRDQPPEQQRHQNEIAYQHSAHETAVARRSRQMHERHLSEAVLITDTTDA